MKPSLLLVFGPSGVGKSAVIDELRALNPELMAVPAYTTRPARARDLYRISVTRQEFEAIRSREVLVAENELYGVRYGTSGRLISEALAAGKSVVADCPIDKVSTYEAVFPGHLFRAYLEPPSLELLRLRQSDGRDPDGRRFAAAKAELLRLARGAFDRFIDVRVVNIDGDAAGAAAEIDAAWTLWSQEQRCRG